MRRSFLPIIVVIAGLLAIWYAAVVPMNIKMALTAAERSGIAVTPVGAKERRDRSAMLLVVQNTFAIKDTFALERPRLPALTSSAAYSGTPRDRFRKKTVASTPSRGHYRN